jgi:hypothetical protein
LYTKIRKASSVFFLAGDRAQNLNVDFIADGFSVRDEKSPSTPKNRLHRGGLLLADHRFGGQHQGADGGGILEGGAGHLGGVDDAGVQVRPVSTEDTIA